MLAPLPVQPVKKTKPLSAKVATSRLRCGDVVTKDLHALVVFFRNIDVATMHREEAGPTHFPQGTPLRAHRPQEDSVVAVEYLDAVVPPVGDVGVGPCHRDARRTPQLTTSGSPRTIRADEGPVLGVIDLHHVVALVHDVEVARRQRDVGGVSEAPVTGAFRADGEHRLDSVVARVGSSLEYLHAAVAAVRDVNHSGLAVHRDALRVL
mmetsp:Transcript_108186/g.304796  ORF Transcript_108186/g.304796 Transcript_108186/m.304796 type:complete len:208 (+) Transcript_108186:61-684(+)